MKIKKIITGTQFLALVALFMVGCSSDDDTNLTNPIRMKVLAKGASLEQLKSFAHPQTGVNLEGSCFLMNLFNPETGDIIGTLEDCIIENIVPGDGTITSRVITTINLHGRGSIIAENEVFQTVQPPVNEFNFITEAIPIENNVINTTFEFEGMKGKVSLNGQVNLANMGEGIVTFNCLFTIDLVAY